MRIFVASYLTELDKECIADDYRYGMSVADAAAGHARCASTNPDKAFDAAFRLMCEDLADMQNDQNSDDPKWVKVTADFLMESATIDADDMGRVFEVQVAPDTVAAIVIAEFELIE